MSGSRGVGIVLFLLAALVYLLVSMPARQAADEAAEQTERARAQRREAGTRLAAVQKRAAFLTRAVALMPQLPAGRDSSVQSVRSRIVRSLREAGVSHVRLEVKPAAAPAVADISLSAESSFEGVIRLIRHVVSRDSGLVLERVALNSGPSGLTLTLEAAALGNAP